MNAVTANYRKFGMDALRRALRGPSHIRGIGAARPYFLLRARAYFTLVARRTIRGI